MWLILALGTALTQALKDACIKRGFGGGLGRGGVRWWLAAWAYCLVLCVLLWPMALLQGVPELGEGFWWALAAGAATNAVAILLYFRAIESSDLSLTVPMLAFTPMLLLVTSPLIVGESPGPLGLAGMVAIVAGSWLLNVGASRQGLLAPFRALFRERGPRLMFLVAVIWSVSANVDKIGVLASSTFFWLAALFTVILAALTPGVAVAWRRERVRAGRREWAAVAATDPDIAAEALDLIEVTYESLPAVFDPEEAMGENAPLVHEEHKSNVLRMP